MPVTVDTTSAPELLIFAVTDPWPTIEVFATLRRWLVEQGLLDASSRALIDIRAVTTPPYTEANAIVAAGMKAGALPLHRAYLVGSAVQFGFARQLQSLAPARMEIEIYTDEAAAMGWLHLRWR